MSEGKRVALPAYFDQGIVAALDKAAARDVGYAHFWIKANAENRQVRREMGWEPAEERALLESLGLKDMIREDGRAHYMDTELWRMPLTLQEAIHEAQDQRLADKSAGLRKALDAMAAEAEGRSKGAVIPYISTGGTLDVVNREPVAPPVAAKK